MNSPFRKTRQLIATTFQLIIKRPILILYPICGMMAGGALISVVTLAGILFTGRTEFQGALTDALTGALTTKAFLFRFSIGLPGTIIWLFFQVALISAIFNHFRGQPIKFGETLKSSLRFLKPICVWSFLVCIVRAAFLLGSWPKVSLSHQIGEGLMTFLPLVFLPIIIYESLPIKKAFSRLLNFLKNSFGEVILGLAIISLYVLLPYISSNILASKASTIITLATAATTLVVAAVGCIFLVISLMLKILISIFAATWYMSLVEGVPPSATSATDEEFWIASKEERKV
jgi:hypothetical protein